LKDYLLISRKKREYRKRLTTTTEQGTKSPTKQPFVTFSDTTTDPNDEVYYDASDDEGETTTDSNLMECNTFLSRTVDDLPPESDPSIISFHDATHPDLDSSLDSFETAHLCFNTSSFIDPDLDPDRPPTTSTADFVEDLSVDDLIDRQWITSATSNSTATAQAIQAKHRVWKDQELEGMKWHLGGIGLDRIKETIKRTTQSAQQLNQYPLLRHVAARFRFLRYPRLREIIATDSIFSSTPSINEGYNGANVFYGTNSKYVRLYPFKSESEFPDTYLDFIKDEGIPSVLHSDNAKTITSKKMEKLHREYNSRWTSTEPHHPTQNPAEIEIINSIKTFGRTIMDLTGAPDNLWWYAWQLYAYTHNRVSNPSLRGKTPMEKRLGQQPDISSLLDYHFYQKVMYHSIEKSPESREHVGHWLGPAETLGDELTYYILTETGTVIARSAIRSAGDSNINFRRLHQLDPNYNVQSRIAQDNTRAEERRRQLLGTPRPPVSPLDEEEAAVHSHTDRSSR